MNTPEIFTKYRPAIFAELQSVMESYEMPLYDMMRYHLGWIDEEGNNAENSPGKALRPTLCLFSCEALNKNYEAALPAAASIELIHNYSLIHDDIQDGDMTRRHRPTVWTIWGMPQAINAGTSMRIIANSALDRLDSDDISAEKRLAIQKILDETTIRLIEGQYLDIDFEGRFDINIEDYLTMIRGKTASLIACSMEIGAIIATDNKKTINLLKELGQNLGIAFQMRDDILGIWGNMDETGKANGNDIRKKKKSMPVVFAMSKATEDEKKQLIDIYSKEELDDQDVTDVLTIMNRYDTFRNVQTMVEKYCTDSREIVYSLNLDSGMENSFSELVSFLTERKH